MRKAHAFAPEWTTLLAAFALGSAAPVPIAPTNRRRKHAQKNSAKRAAIRVKFTPAMSALAGRFTKQQRTPCRRSRPSQKTQEEARRQQGPERRKGKPGVREMDKGRRNDKGGIRRPLGVISVKCGFYRSYLPQPPSTGGETRQTYQEGAIGPC